MNKVIIGLTLLIITISSCTNTKESSTYLDDAVELTAIEVFSESVYRGSNTRTIDLIHTDLEISFNWEQQHLYGKAMLTLKPYFYKINEVVLDDIDRNILFHLSKGIKTKNLTEHIPLSLAAIEKRKRHLKEVFDVEKKGDESLLEQARNTGFL